MKVKDIGTFLWRYLWANILFAVALVFIYGREGSKGVEVNPWGLQVGCVVFGVWPWVGGWLRWVLGRVRKA